MAIVSFGHPDSVKEVTRITAAISAAGVTLTVQNTEGFVANNYIVLGVIGNEQTELVKITTVDSDTQLTIGAVRFGHSVDDLVSFISYNVIEFSSASTVGGSKTIQTTSSIEIDDLVSESNLSSVTSGFVFARFFNQQTSTFSGYSSPIPVAGFSENSLRYIIDQARLRTQELDDNIVNDNDLLNFAKECSDEIETVRKKWGFVQQETTFDLTAGVQSYYRPTNLSGLESIERLFLGIDNKDLDYIDSKDFWYKMRSMPRTYLTSVANSGATTLTIRDSSAFGSTGTLSISGLTGISYTGKSNKSFTGVTGVTTTFTANAEIFRTSDTDQPIFFSVWKNHLKMYPPVDKFYVANLHYYETIPRMTNISSETVVPMPHLYIWYLMSEIFRMRRKSRRADYYARKFERRLKLLVRKNRNKQGIRMQPAKQYFDKQLRDDSDILIERLHGSS